MVWLEELLYSTKLDEEKLTVLNRIGKLLPLCPPVLLFNCRMELPFKLRLPALPVPPPLVPPFQRLVPRFNTEDPLRVRFPRILSGAAVPVTILTVGLLVLSKTLQSQHIQQLYLYEVMHLPYLIKMNKNND